MHGFPKEELISKKTLIFQNLLQSMTQLIYGVKLFDIKLSLEEEVYFYLIIRKQIKNLLKKDIQVRKKEILIC